MPDKWGFNLLPHRGVTYHQCVECDWPGYGHIVSEDDRRKHFEQHDRARKKEAKRARNKALHAARQAAAEKRREDKIAYGRNAGGGP